MAYYMLLPKSEPNRHWETSEKSDLPDQKMSAREDLKMVRKCNRQLTTASSPFHIYNPFAGPVIQNMLRAPPFQPCPVQKFCWLSTLNVFGLTVVKNRHSRWQFPTHYTSHLYLLPRIRALSYGDPFSSEIMGLLNHYNCTNAGQ